MNIQPLLVICGPTASGKTALAVELALRFSGEVVSADSMQIYKGMSIATAKPTCEERRGVPHHLVDFLDPNGAAFSVADYVRLAREALAQIYARGALPVLTGGTGLYIRALTDGIDYDGFSGDSEIRTRLTREAGELGADAMFQRLRAADAPLAEHLHPNNLGRVLRALEVWEATGIPMSEHQRRSRLRGSPYRLCMLGLGFRDRALLYERIDRRVDAMLQAGLVREARDYSALYGTTAQQAIGYKELAPYFAGEATLSACVEHLKQATRNYAKRQLTWFSRDSHVHWLYADELGSFSNVCAEAEKVIHKCEIL